MKMKNVEVFLQRKYTKAFRFIDNRSIDKPMSALQNPLNQSKIALITSAGLYLKESKAFDTEALKGDTTYRKIDKHDTLETLDIAHTHYDHKFIKEDINTVYPMILLEELKDKNQIGQVSDVNFSFCGFVLDTEKLITETAVGILEDIKEEGIDAVILAPVWPVCNQSVGLIARYLESNGIPTVTINMFEEVGIYNEPPRILFTKHDFGAPFGDIGDIDTQRQTLIECLKLLENE